MLKNIAGETIKLSVATNLREGETLCKTCGGTGFLLNDYTNKLVYCSDCHFGVVNICSECGKTYRGSCVTPTCEETRKSRFESERFEKAHKYKCLEDVPENLKGMLYSDVYKYDNGYFTQLEDLYDFCTVHNVEVPNYVWCTTKSVLSLDASDILDMYCEDLHESAKENISTADIKELQDYLTKWCEKQSTSTETYYTDYAHVLLLSGT